MYRRHLINIKALSSLICWVLSHCSLPVTFKINEDLSKLIFLIKQAKKISLKSLEPTSWLGYRASVANQFYNLLSERPLVKWPGSSYITVLAMASKYWGWLVMHLCKKIRIIIDRKSKSNFAFFSPITVERVFMGKKWCRC